MAKIMTEGLLTPIRPKPDKKASNTDAAARAIIDAEASSRDAKTARLREARLLKEAQEEQERIAAPPKPTARSRKKLAS